MKTTEIWLLEWIIDGQRNLVWEIQVEMDNIDFCWIKLKRAWYQIF